MLYAQFRTAWRSLRKDRQFTILNMLGLSTGLACTILIFLWVQDERQVDKFNEKDAQLFQVMHNTESPQGIETGDQTPGLLAATLANDLPEVEQAVSVIPATWVDKKGIIGGNDRPIAATNQFVGKAYFDLFSFRFLAGDAKQAMASKSSIVLSKELAMKLFNTTEGVVGRQLEWNQKDYSGVYQVTGIVEPNVNSTIHFDIAFSYELFLEKNAKLQKWTNNQPATYVRLKQGTDLTSFNHKITSLLNSRQGNTKGALFVQLFSDRYLHGHYENGVPDGGRIVYVNLFSAIAAFILLIACINFMNLSTAKAERRFRDAGVRKVLGARRAALVAQFLAESMLLTGVSALLAMGCVLLLLPQFNQLTGKQLSIPFNTSFALAVVGISWLTGLIAGSYPAVYLSASKPVVILRGKFSGSLRELSIRKGLVVFQFTISVVFIVAVIVVYRQVQFIQTKHLGYDRDQVIYFEKGGAVSANKADYAPGGKYESDMANLLQRIKQIPGVVNAANFRHNITNRDGGTYDLSWPEKDPNARIDFTDLAIGYDLIETAGMQLTAGRSYARSYGSESSNIIFNEAAIAVMGLKDPIGKTVYLWGAPRQIIGVVKDFNFQSLHEALKPCFLDLTVNQWASKIMVKLKAGQERAAIHQLEALYKEYNQGMALEYTWLDDDYQALYASEMKVATLSKYFAGLAILISCLGLFGLATFTAHRRRKEIGVRKVVGATVGHVVILLSKDYLRLIAVSILIAFPLSWWVLFRWLNGFAYRVELGVDVFAIAAGATMLITFLSIGIQSVRAALTNPVNSLRLD